MCARGFHREKNNDSREVTWHEDHGEVKFQEDAEDSSLGDREGGDVRVIKRNKAQKKSSGLFVYLFLFNV